MNLWCIAGLAILVAIEKVSASRHWVSMISGAALVAAGTLIAATSH